MEYDLEKCININAQYMYMRAEYVNISRKFEHTMQNTNVHTTTELSSEV